ncbi:DUF1697 domain-containing protein [Aurantiacibacter sp. D1-12]|uniref:DUF1697 domain-containing protein n=1 Tax=Aurantiacibacter sp. D1-12 TaxID=2993658 RepID=UPI00237CB89B|nr:DUF1697 domain-containing protein [Aurantiacibacter sp. D1-12]MDE1466967.1 DUF1697 domain-containing protein [Aurantiacibacter sp. D1-12]
MTTWIVLLRAVNVGGTGKIAMAPLREALAKSGFPDVRSYIASGNLVFTGPDDVEAVRAQLTAVITKAFGWCPDLILRTADEIADVETRNPFPDAAGNQLLVIFTDEAPSIDGIRHQADEQLAPGEREVFVHYPSGMGTSKMVVPAAKTGTGRNMNTVRKLAAMAADLA